jgi:UDP-N-acetylglucosamine--N-acetylmuramyl-(pentapeptide) pyrophosphoryl-undecaprenol N-acetylglucosamine transferase
MPPASHPTLIFTGGHHTSALAVAADLKAKGWQIIWLGHRQSQWRDRADSAEYREVKAAGIEFTELKAGKIYRTYHPLKLLRLPLGFIRAFLIILGLRLKLKSDLKGIVTFGGYLGVPVVFGGWLLHVPVIAHEQTMTAGWANRFISLFAQKIAVSWPKSLTHFPKSKKVLTGLPLRPEIVRAKSCFTRTDVVAGQIYVTGGKQGSHVINTAVLSALGKLLSGHSVIHQTGSSTVYGDFGQAVAFRQSLPSALQDKYQVREYLDPETTARMLATSQVVIARSGAHITNELAFFGTRCVLVPIPWSSHNEQLKNARFLALSRQAVILPQEKLSGESLVDAVSRAARLRPRPVSVPADGLTRMVSLIEQEWGRA